jgi:hypothetical protein
MPNYIALRLTPPTPVDAATFTSYLNGLTINVFDISYADSTAGTKIGSGAFVSPPFPPPASTQIVQHSLSQGAPPVVSLESVATALIPYTPPVLEYDQPDLRIEFRRNGTSSVVSRSYYNVQTVQTLADIPSVGIQAILDSAVSAFVTLPPVDAQIVVPNDGTPPAFQIY